MTNIETLINKIVEESINTYLDKKASMDAEEMVAELFRKDPELRELYSSLLKTAFRKALENLTK